MKTEGEKSSFLKCIPKSNVILKFFWVLVFGIGILLIQGIDHLLQKS